MMYSFLLDGCSPETLAVTAGSSLSIMWPEVDIRVVARPICPCGNVVSIIIIIVHTSHLFEYTSMCFIFFTFHRRLILEPLE